MTADPNRLEIYCLDTGQGDCTVILPPHTEGDPILFDCADPYIAERFLDNHAIRRLEAVVASHLDIDHVGGLLSLLTNYFTRGGRVGRLILAIDRQGHGDAAAALIDAAVRWADNPPCPDFELVAPHRGNNRLRLAGAGDWHVDLVLPFYQDVLAAQSVAHASNTASAVLRVERGGTAVLLGADAPLRSWERLTANELRANTIRTPHHGGDLGRGTRWTAYTDLYDAVKADRAVFSVGTNNRHGHPLPDHVQAARRGQQCRILCTQMTARCHRDPMRVRDEALRIASAVEYPYRHRTMRGHPARRPAEEVPCASTVLIALDHTGRVFVQPRPQLHKELIDQLDSPMCSA